MRTVVALGGNALVAGGEGTVAEQRENVAAAAAELADLDERGHDLVVTHGNGPQVGTLLRQQAAADVPERPLDVLVAETQGQVGYLVADALDAAFADRAVPVVTRSRVDPDDPAFDEPTKPVGPYYGESEAAEKPFPTAQVETEAGERAYRRVVPSPRPCEVLEADRVASLVDAGATVVCAGGGGVPVVPADDSDDSDDPEDPDDAIASTGGQAYEGVPAVVDKDYTSRLVATRVDADLLVMATDVEYAYRDFESADSEPIERVDAATMRKHLAAGEFAEGSMRPKVEACLAFLDSGGDEAVIAATDRLAAAVDGEVGTRIVPASVGTL